MDPAEILFFSSFLFPILNIAGNHDARLRRRRYRIPRIQGYVDLCGEMTANVFKSHFRVYPTTVEEIMGHIYRTFFPNHPEKLKKRGVLLSLWYLANMEGFRQIADRFGISLAGAHRTISTFCNSLNRVPALKVRWPPEAGIAASIASFNSLRENAFPGVVGAIDGCHVRILAPWRYRTKMPHLDRNSFINRKQVASVILQGVCNANLQFMSVFAGWPGSSNDARVFRRSEIGIALLNRQGFLPPNAHIIGDCAYPLLPTLMTPYRDTGHLSEEQRFYNFKLSSSRIVIEQAFGKLLGRFRRLKLLEVYNKNLASLYIMSCCVLHNLCQSLGDNIEPVEYDSGVPPQLTPRSTASGSQKRDRIARSLFEGAGMMDDEEVEEF